MKFPAEKKYTYGLSQGEVKNSDLQLKLQLIGSFNIYNALAAICVSLSQGIRLETAKRAVEETEGVPGRMEEVISSPFKVFVDYAFTSNALEQVYKTLKTELLREARGKKRMESSSPPSQGEMIAVLGACGGGRDKWKRPVLGELAAKYCERVIVTNEDPYDEDPMEIIEQVAQGTKGRAEKILDRREAIRKALGLAKAGDVVIITGKGCEPWIVEAHGKKIPWDDREVVKEEFAEIAWQ